MISATSIGSGGLAAAAQRFGARAETVAAIGTSLPGATQVDLSSAAVRLIADKAGFEADAAVLRMAVETDRKVLDIRV